MNTKILTEDERSRARVYIRQGGKKELGVRKLAYGARHYLPTVKSDMALLETFLSRYDASANRASMNKKRSAAHGT